MRFTGYSFGSIQVNGVTYDHDLVVDRGKIRKRKKAGSRKFRDAYGHTPLSVAEDIPWRCRRLVIGTGADGALPVMQDVRNEARRREMTLSSCPRPRRWAGLPGLQRRRRHLAPDLLNRVGCTPGSSLPEHAGYRSDVRLRAGAPIRGEWASICLHRHAGIMAAMWVVRV